MIIFRYSLRYGHPAGSLIRGFAKPKNKFIYPDELLENQRNARFQLYLKVGDMDDILNMAPWDFFGVCETLHENNSRKPGKHKPLKQSQMDMIKKVKNGS